MSKLIELMLAADIKWPAGYVNLAAQDLDTDVVYWYKLKPSINAGARGWRKNYMNTKVPGVELQELASDWNTSTVSQREYYLAGGWVEYGNPVPLEPGDHEFQYIEGPLVRDNPDHINWSQVKYFRRVVSRPGLYDTHVDPVVIEPVEPVIIGERDHSWYNKSVFPPVGCECNAHITSENKWVSIEVVAHKDGHLLGWCSKEKFGYHTDTVKDLRPLLTEHEKAIEDMVTILKRFDCSPYEIAEALVDAGYHK